MVRPDENGIPPREPLLTYHGHVAIGFLRLVFGPGPALVFAILLAVLAGSAELSPFNLFGIGILAWLGIGLSLRAIVITLVSLMGTGRMHWPRMEAGFGVVLLGIACHAAWRLIG